MKDFSLGTVPTTVREQGRQTSPSPNDDFTIPRREIPPSSNVNLTTPRRGKRKKYSVSFRKEAVDQVLLDKRSVFKVGQELGIDKSLIRRWVLSYQKHGIMGLMPLHQENYSAEFKIRVIKTMRSKSLSLLETCIQFNVRSTGALTKWIALYDEKGAEGLVRKETNPKMPMAKSPKKPKSKDEELLEELASLRAENAYLKKLYALIQADKEKEEKRNSSTN